MPLMTKSNNLRIMRDPYIPYDQKMIKKYNDSTTTTTTATTLMSPPLTPIELYHPTTTSSSCSNIIDLDEKSQVQSWYNDNQQQQYNKRKEFITSYSKMVPFLKRQPASTMNQQFNDDNNNKNSVFALNVYRDLFLINEDKSITTENNKVVVVAGATTTPSNNNNNNKSVMMMMMNNTQQQEQQQKENDCAMLDKPVVQHSRKRNLSFTSYNFDQTTTEEEQDKTNNKKKRRISSILPTGKEAAIAFDSIDIDSMDQDFYPIGWVPFTSALDQVPVKVYWKGKKK